MDGISRVDADAMIGRTFGEFVVRELLSTGGFGLVFRAEQPALSREAVIKVLQVRHRSRDTVVQRFLREAQLTSKLDHPYAAHTYAFGAEPDGVLWIAMELVRGTPLDQLIVAQGSIPLERFVPLLERICEVIHTAHEQGIVHRDLKPANVMVLSRAGRLLPKLLDLGLAKLGGDERSGAVSASFVSLPAGASTAATMEASDVLSAGSVGRLTEDGATMGSPLYMAPEQWFDAGTADARTDQYALGVLCYEALTGKPPFVATTAMALAQAHARDAPPPLGRGLPPALDLVLARAMAKLAGDRYPGVLELASAFRAASGVAAEPVTLPRLPEPLRLVLLATAPQPLAQAVASLDAARNAHHARDALWQVVRVAVRLLGVAALASHAHVGAGTSISQSGSEETMRRLRHRGVSDLEWLEVARELCRPFETMRDAHPVPELVAFLCGEGKTLRGLLALRAEDSGGGTDEQVRDLLAHALPLVAQLLDELAFLAAYPMVVSGEGAAELWTGVRRTDRAQMVLRGKPLPAGQPALVDASGLPVLALWPYVQVAAPSPGASDHVFFFDGQGRRGARLVALPDSFEREDEALWETFGGGLEAAGSASISSEEKSPFPGLAAFTQDDAGSFFGRERETEAFVNRLRVQPLLAVVGPSGAGKSSFVQAGVVPALPEGWYAITVRPGPAPLVSLAARLQASGIDVGDLRDELREHPGALGAILRARRRGTMVLVVDQLEELFTLCEDGEERGLYVEALARAARSADDPVRVVFTLRDDFLLAAEALPALRSRLGQGLQLLTTPVAEDLRRILLAPIARAGYELDDPTLADEMVDAIAGAPGALALLSFTASKLWELRDRRFRQLSKKAYQSIGGVGGALAQHAETTLKAMTSDEQRLVREVFRHAVTAEGTRAVLTRAELGQVLGGGPHAAAVVEKLLGARLLVASEEDRIEVTHEALLEAWPRLVGWRREDVEGARLRDQLRAAARQWEERARATGLLWRGDALAEYRLWRARTAGALTASEEAFTAASLADTARARRRVRWMVGGAFALLLVGLVVLNHQRSRAESAARELHDNLERQYENQGRRLVLDGDPLQALAYLARAGSLGAHGRAHDLLVAQAIRATDGEVLEIEHDGLGGVRFSPDGSRLLTRGLDGTARIWDARTGAALQAFHHGGEVIAASFSPDGKRVVTGSADGTAALWDVGSGERLHAFAHEGPVRCAAYAPDGDAIVTASFDDTVKVWDATTGGLRWSARGDGAGQYMCLFSPDGAAVASGDNAGTVRLWDARTGAGLATLHEHRDRVRMLQFSPDGTRLLTASRDGTAIEWDVASARALQVLHHTAAVMSAVFSTDGERIATASNDHTAVVWNARTGEKLLTLAGHEAGVNRALFTPDGRLLVTASDDGTARLWDASSGRLVARWFGHRDEITEADLDAAGDRVATASFDGRAIVWDARPQERVTWLVGHTGIVDAAAFSPDGARVVTAGHDGTARIWDASTAREQLVLRGHDGAVHWASFSPDGRTVATGGDDSTVRLWDAGTGAPLHVMRGHTGPVNTLGWAPDGSSIVSASDDGTIRVWAPATGALRFTVTAHGGAGVRSATYLPDGLAIATSGDDNATRIWDSATGTLLRERAHPELIGGIAFAPGGTRAASPISRRLRIWDVTTDAVEVEMIGHVGEVTAPIAPWSPDGTLVVSGASDGTARIWDSASGDLLAELAHGRQIWSAGFSPDGTRILTSADDGTAAIREVPRWEGTAADLDDLLRCRVPFWFEGDHLSPRVPDRSACRSAPDAR